MKSYREGHSKLRRPEGISLLHQPVQPPELAA